MGIDITNLQLSVSPGLSPDMRKLDVSYDLSVARAPGAAQNTEYQVSVELVGYDTPNDDPPVNQARLNVMRNLIMYWVMSDIKPMTSRRAHTFEILKSDLDEDRDTVESRITGYNQKGVPIYKTVVVNRSDEIGIRVTSSHIQSSQVLTVT